MFRKHHEYSPACTTLNRNNTATPQLATDSQLTMNCHSCRATRSARKPCRKYFSHNVSRVVLDFMSHPDFEDRSWLFVAGGACSCFAPSRPCASIVSNHAGLADCCAGVWDLFDSAALAASRRAASSRIAAPFLVSASISSDTVGACFAGCLRLSHQELIARVVAAGTLKTEVDRLQKHTCINKRPRACRQKILLSIKSV